MATMFSHLTDDNLRAMYSESSWGRMNEDQKLALLQETVDREIAVNGGGYTCRVEFADLAPGVAGEQSGDIIRINRDMAVNGCFSVTHGDRTITYDLPDSNIRAYETLHHEHRHALQNAWADGVVPTDSYTRAVCMANDFTVSDVDGRRGSQYLRGETSHAMYQLNPTEADAFRTGEARGVTLAEELNQRYGNTNSCDHYLHRMEANSFDAQIEQYKILYNNPDPEKEVRNVLLNHRFDTDIPVDKNIETLVNREMVESQAAIDRENGVDTGVSSATDVSDTPSVAECAESAVDCAIDMD